MRLTSPRVRVRTNWTSGAGVRRYGITKPAPATLFLEGLSPCDVATSPPESLRRRRNIANALAQQSLTVTPQNMGEGIEAIGQALAGKYLDGQTWEDWHRLCWGQRAALR